MCNGQAVQLHDVVARLNIEERISIAANVQTSLEKDLDVLLEKTDKCPKCFICKKHFVKSAYEHLVVSLTSNRMCGHVFHASCVVDKMAANPSCPACNMAPVFLCNLIFDH